MTHTSTKTCLVDVNLRYRPNL